MARISSGAMSGDKVGYGDVGVETLDEDEEDVLE